MADSEKIPEPNNADIVAIGQRLEALSATVLRIEAQGRSNGEQLTKAHWLLGEVRDAVRPDPERDRDPLSAAGMLAEVLETVRDAAPLLQSRAAKALRAGGSVVDYIKAGRGRG